MGFFLYTHKHTHTIPIQWLHICTDISALCKFAQPHAHLCRAHTLLLSFSTCVWFDRQTCFSLPSLKSNSVKLCHMATATDGSCRSKAYSAVCPILIFAAMPPVCFPVFLFTCQSLMSHTNAPSYSFLFGKWNAFWLFFFSYLIVLSLFSRCSLFLLMFPGSLFSLFFPFFLPVPLSFCWA